MLTRPSHVIALCSMANFINSADRVIMPIAIVPMADEFKWDLHGQGWVLSSFSVGYLSSQVVPVLLQSQFIADLQHTHNPSITLLTMALKYVLFIHLFPFSQ